MPDSSPRAPSPRAAALACAAALGSLVAARAAAAQTAPDAGAAPAATPLADSVYGFAVRPADHPREPYVYLLRAEWARHDADGGGARTVREVVQVLNPTAVGHWATLTLNYNADRETLSVDHARVVRPGGEVVSAAPSVDREGDAVPTGADPVFDHTRVRRLVLSGVAVGTLVDVQFTVRGQAPPLRGDFAHDFRFTPGVTAVRSFLEVDVPAGVRPQVVTRGLDAAGVVATTSDSAGRRRYRWAARDVAPQRAEPFTPAAFLGRAAEARVGGPVAWGDVGRWYAGEVRDRAAITPVVEAKLREVTAGARTLADSLAALHRYVAGDLRYVSVALGRGAYQPRPPELVVQTGYGDCKDKAMLFVAAARRWGVEAYPVLVAAAPPGADAPLATAHAFNHLIAAVRDPGAPRAAPLHLVDLTASYVPYAELPLGDQGRFALLVRPDGSADTLRLPVAPPAATYSLETVVATVDTAGVATGSATMRESGAAAPAVRALLWSPPDATRRATFGQALAQRIAPAAVADSVELPDAHDLGHEPDFRLTFHGGALVRRSGGTGVLALGFTPNGAQFAATLAALRKEAGPRRAPFDARGLVPSPAGGVGVLATEFTLTLPAGWTAELPKSVDVAGPLGRYTAVYEQHGRVLHVLRRAEAAGGVVPAERADEVARFLQAAAGDDVSFLVVHAGA